LLPRAVITFVNHVCNHVSEVILLTMEEEEEEERLDVLFVKRIHMVF